MKDARSLDAEALLSKSVWGLTESWSAIQSFRRVAKAGLPHASEVITQENLAHANSVLRRLFPDNDVGSMAKAQTDRCLTDAQYAVDAASLVFAHSVTDAAAYDYCRVTALACPTAWESRLLGKQVSLADAMKYGSHFLLLRALAAHLRRDVERCSLPEKADILHAVCRPPSGWRPPDLAAYSYDPARLRRLDCLRHKIVHNPGVPVTLGDMEGHLFYLNMTMFYLLDMVKDRCKVSVNLAHVFGSR